MINMLSVDEIVDRTSATLSNKGFDYLVVPYGNEVYAFLNDINQHNEKHAGFHELSKDVQIKVAPGHFAKIKISQDSNGFNVDYDFKSNSRLSESPNMAAAWEVLYTLGEVLEPEEIIGKRIGLLGRSKRSFSSIDAAMTDMEEMILLYQANLLKPLFSQNYRPFPAAPLNFQI